MKCGVYDFAVNRLLIAGIGLLCLSAAALGAADNLGYSPDGGLVSFGEFDYVYDSASRLTEVWSNGARVVENQYDALDRRVIKRTPDATHTFVYDGWLLMVERVERSNGMLEQIDYWWGKDVSGTLDGAGGIGGLLYLRKNGCDVYVPLYDGHGNVVQYVNSQGAIVASYAYDAFGNTVQKSGVKADELKMRFSTKYHDDEAGLYYFGRRFYSPRIARWLTRDPIEEDGGLNLYAYCGNDAVGWIDPYGENRYITQFDILNLGKSGGTQIHVGVAVDRWRCIKGRWVRSGISTFDFRPKQTVLNLIKSIAAGDGVIEESEGLHVKAPVTIKSTPEQDKKMLNMIRREMANPPFYNPIFHNCIFWSVGAVNYGMQKNK